MLDENYQITDYFHDEVVAFVGALNIKGELSYKDHEMYSTDRSELESYNPVDTILVATFFHEKYSTKKIYFYASSFTEPNWKASNMEVYSLFSIQWDEECSLWKKLPWYCCSVISDKSQPSLHKEAANWMIKRMTTEGCLVAPVDVFKKGILDILI